MSIVTYDDLDTPVFELDTMRYLFRDGLQGMWIDYAPDYTFSDTGLTTPANPGEGIAGYVDRGPYGYDGTQPVITARPILGRVPVGGRRNWVETSDAQSWVSGGEVLVTPGIDDPYGGTEAYRCVGNSDPYRLNAVPVGGLAAFPGQQMTLTFWVRWVSGSPDIRLNGRVSVFSFPIDTSGEWTKYSVNTPDLVSTFQQIRLRQDQVVDIAFVQLELGTEETPYQRVGNEYDITEAGVPSVYYAHYDGADDVLPSSLTIPSISEGCFILVGTAGIWIDNEWVNTTGTLTVGPTTYTGGPSGILPVVGNILSIIWREEPLTEAEKAEVVRYGVKRGSPGEIE